MFSSARIPSKKLRIIGLAVVIGSAGLGAGMPQASAGPNSGWQANKNYMPNGCVGKTLFDAMYLSYDRGWQFCDQWHKWYITYGPGSRGGVNGPSGLAGLAGRAAPAPAPAIVNVRAPAGHRAFINNSAGPVSARAQHLANVLDAAVPAITSMGGTRRSAVDMAGHPSGNAIDFMVPNNAVGDHVFNVARSQWHQLGIKYIIWEQRYYSSPTGGGSAMADRGSPTANHWDHVHINVIP